ncbi:S-layer homology domain-containing protein [Psychrobacillus sp. FSL H8-0483]|uniref:S-layer homology domain-containing protein n=1 Tax=Psychrobacillus sp. FSL H8-0483 TaxID=2921389 RepID=UPI00315A17A3
MANQPTKYRKFLAGAASAALVATAVVPTALAAELTDIKGNTHEAAIKSLVEKGIISGYPDGTFQPNKDLTRSDVVKLLGKWLETLGAKVPADYKTVQRFDDVPVTANEELVKYAALVKDNGVFVGSNGKLLAADKISRENMALVLVRAFDAVNKTEIVKYVNAQTFTKEVTDLAAAKEEARDAINVLDFFNITTVTTFNPKGNVTRGQFSTFLNNLIKTEVPTTNATKVASVSATNLKEVTVTFDGTVDKASAENKSAYNLKQDGTTLGLKSARLQADGKSVVLTLDANPLVNQEEHTLTVTNVKTTDKTKTVSAKDVAFTPVDGALPTVEKVEGLGNKAVKITFSEPVNINSTVAGTFKLDDKAVSGIISGNGTRTVIVELFSTQTTGKHTLSINNQVQDFAGYKLVSTSVDFDVVEDVTAPTVVEVKDVTLEGATVVFSEDVKDGEALKGSNYFWMNGSTKHAANAVTEKIDGKTFKLTFSGDHKLPAVATDLNVTNVVDYSGNKIAADTKVTINPVIDQTRPEVVSAIFADTNDSLTLTFNKNINPASFKVGNVVLKDEDGKAVTGYGYTITEAASTSSRTLTVNFSEALDAGTYTFELSGIQDTTTLKNTALPIVEKIVVEDVAKPSVTSVTGDGNVYYVNFSKDMDTSSQYSVLNPENYYVKYVQNNVTKVGKLPASTNLTPVNGNKGVIITLPSSVTSLQEITIQGVKGANGEYINGFSDKFSVNDANPLKRITNSFDVVRVHATATNKLLVKFNQPVSSIDKSQFTLSNGVTVSDYAIQADNTLVELTLSGTVSQDAVETISFTDTAARNLVDKKVTLGTAVNIEDSIAPSIVRNSADNIAVVTVADALDTAGLEAVTTSGDTTVEVNFGENITVKNASNLINNFSVFQANGLELEYGVGGDYTVATDANGFTLNFSNSSYAGVVYITFDNANGNVVDASAVKTSDGTATTALAAKGFNTRTEGVPVSVSVSAVSDATAANAVKAQITAATTQAQIEAARTAFAGLTAAQKLLVTNESDLQTKEQGLVNAVAAGITTFAPAAAAAGTVALPTVPTGYTIAVNTTSAAAVYDTAGKLQTTGSSNVVYTVTHTASLKTTDTVSIAVAVTVTP